MSRACSGRVSPAWWRMALSCICWASLSACSAPDSAAVGSVEPPSARCAACHLQEFQATTHPPHPGVRPTTCAVCHSETDWHPARKVLVHSFPLDGAHAKTACFNCHSGPTPVFEGTTQLCANCHQKEHESANAKIAHHASFPNECQTCHTTTAWKPTLPHDEPAGSAETNEPPRSVASGESSHSVPTSEPRTVATSAPASVPSAPSTAPARIKPTVKPPKAQPAATSTWSNTPTTPKPDQVSGASRTKSR